MELMMVRLVHPLAFDVVLMLWEQLAALCPNSIGDVVQSAVNSII